MNKFVACGKLIEFVCRIYSTHINVKTTLDINGQIIQTSQTSSRKWNADECNAVFDILPKLHPKVDGIVYNVDKPYFFCRRAYEISRVIVGGNINEWRNTAYFNAKYIRLMQSCQQQDILDIQIDGQWVDNNRLLNVCYDSPRIFNLPKPAGISEKICRLSVGYNCGFTVKDNTVLVHDGGIWVKSVEETDSYFTESQVDNYMLEYEIISEEK